MHCAYSEKPGFFPGFSFYTKKRNLHSSGVLYVITPFPFEQHEILVRNFIIKRSARPENACPHIAQRPFSQAFPTTRRSILPIVLNTQNLSGIYIKLNFIKHNICVDTKIISYILTILTPRRIDTHYTCITLIHVHRGGCHVLC